MSNLPTISWLLLRAAYNPALCVWMVHSLLFSCWYRTCPYLIESFRLQNWHPKIAIQQAIADNREMIIGSLTKSKVPGVLDNYRSFHQFI